MTSPERLPDAEHPQASAEYLDVRKEAHRLDMKSVDLRKELVDDGFDIITISKGVHRVERVAMEAWIALRHERTREALRQRERRADYVKGRNPPKRRPSFGR